MTGGGELFAHGDVDSLASAIAGLLADPGKRQRLGARGRASVDAMFNSRQMADSITRIYSECL